MIRACLSILTLFAATYAIGAFVPGEPGTFVFTDPGYFRDKPVTVYYYKASMAGPEARVVIALHGVDRSGQMARDNWIELAEKHDLIVLAPEFDAARFPERLFQFGGMTERDPSQRTFAIVEHLFEQVRRDDALRTPSYVLFGHSAGAQFAHRFVLTAERSHLSAAVTANAGTYTMPEWPVERERLRAAFGQKLIVLLGENDTRTDGPDVPRSKEALAQGANRLERGQKFYGIAKAEAQKLGTELQWQLVTVPGIGHSSKGMSRAAARVLFGDTKP
jgi:poly(3-hydroxybutyrate) depolymerase